MRLVKFSNEHYRMLVELLDSSVDGHKQENPEATGPCDEEILLRAIEKSTVYLKEGD